MNVTPEQFAEMQARVRANRSGAPQTETPSPTPPSLAAPVPTTNTERDEQVDLAGRLDALLGVRGWFHIPNQRSSKKQRGKLKGEGVKPGVPDIMCIVRPPDGSPGVVVEMKSPKHKGTRNPQAGTKENQRAWLWALAEQGWHAMVCNSADKAFAFIYEIYFGGVK